jgi:hypothetical protein
MNAIQQQLIDNVNTSLDNAYNNQSKLSPESLLIEGMTGIKTCHFYNNLLSMSDARYLEIGVYKGSSVCAAMCNNSATVVCIDNWSDGIINRDIFLDNFNNFKGLNNANFIESDCFQLDISTLPKINIFMYDADSRDDSYYKALKYYIGCLDNTFIYIVDDWNWLNARNDTYRAITDLNLIINYEKSIMVSAESFPDKEGWWNGLGIFVLTKPTV